MGRNNIKKIEKLDEVCGTLEQLWMSYNQISSLEGLSELNNLTTLFLSNNSIKSFSKVEKVDIHWTKRISKPKWVDCWSAMTTLT